MNDTGRTVVIVILVLVVLPLLWGVTMMGGGGGMGPGMMGGWDRPDPWRAALSTVSTVLVIGGIGAVVWWAFGRTASAPPPSGQSSARDILDTRYARGELTRDQYQAMRQDLES